MKFKGEPVVLVGAEGQRSPFGAWVNTFNWEGIPIFMADLANRQPLGVEVKTQQKGAVVGVDITYAPDTFTDKWEVDRENVDKDLMYNIAFNGLSDTAKQEVRRWRADPTGLTLFTTPGVPVTTLPVPSGGVALQLVAGDVALMNKVKDLVLRGVEAYQVSTLILKRTRTMSVNLAPTLDLNERTQVFTTAKLITLEGIPSSLGDTLPVNPYAPPSNTQWAWLPRNSNRSYIARGIMEEHSDWVFAAWSTVLYALVS